MPGTTGGKWGRPLTPPPTRSCNQNGRAFLSGHLNAAKRNPNQRTMKTTIALITALLLALPVALDSRSPPPFNWDRVPVDAARRQGIGRFHTRPTGLPGEAFQFHHDPRNTRRATNTAARRRASPWRPGRSRSATRGEGAVLTGTPRATPTTGRKYQAMRDVSSRRAFEKQSGRAGPATQDRSQLRPDAAGRGQIGGRMRRRRPCANMEPTGFSPMRWARARTRDWMTKHLLPVAVRVALLEETAP